MFKVLMTAIIASLVSFAAIADDLVSQQEYTDRRAHLASKLGDNDVLIVFANKLDNYSEDVDYPYHPNGTLRYLTGTTQEETIYVMQKGKAKLHQIFTKDYNLQYEKWIGKVATHDDVRKISGIQNILSHGEFDEAITKILNAMPEGSTLWLERGNDPEREDYSSAQLFANEHREQLTEEGVTIKSYRSLTHKMREIKSPGEIEALRVATEISALGHNAGMRRAVTATKEYQVEAAIEQVYRDMGAEALGYPSIVGAGRNTTILHYNTNQEAIPEGALILVDSAAEYQGYSSDITRTFPHGGKFTEEQKDIYNVVLAAQNAAIEASKPGAKYSDLSQAAFPILAQGLIDLGLINEMDMNQLQLFVFHGLGHGVGLNVHDPNPDNNLQPGAVFTIEPGIYVNKHFVMADPKFKALPKETQDKIMIAVEKYDTIGVRIEDVILITEDGYENLSKSTPKTIDEIESLMAGK